MSAWQAPNRASIVVWHEGNGWYLDAWNGLYPDAESALADSAGGLTHMHDAWITPHDAAPWPFGDTAAEVMGIVSRKAAGIDCNAHESCVILRYFDIAHPDTLGGTVAVLFPLELDQWWDERERGWR